MTTSKKMAAIISIAFLFMVTCKDTSTEPTVTESEKLLPTENAVSGWTFDPDSNCFEGVATTKQALTDLIDGDANQYVDRGFISGAFDGYTDLNKVICIEIYEQKNSDSALSVFKYYYNILLQAETANIGDTAVFDIGYPEDLILLIYAQEFFIRLTVYSSKEDTYKNALISFGQSIVNKIGKHDE